MIKWSLYEFHLLMSIRWHIWLNGIHEQTEDYWIFKYLVSLFFFWIQDVPKPLWTWDYSMFGRRALRLKSSQQMCFSIFELVFSFLPELRPLTISTNCLLVMPDFSFNRQDGIWSGFSWAKGHALYGHCLN